MKTELKSKAWPWAITTGLMISFATAGSVTATRSNLAPVAKPTTSFVSGDETMAAVNDGFEPASSKDLSHPRHCKWPSKGTRWVRYEWEQPISTSRTDVFWWADCQGIHVPKGCRASFPDDSRFLPVKGAKGLGLDLEKSNTTIRRELKTGDHVALEIPPVVQRVKTKDQAAARWSRSRTVETPLPLFHPFKAFIP